SGKGVRLYVRRVFIMEDAESLVPEWLRFMRGVIDSEDLPLNVSREILQQERITAGIRKQVTNKTLALLEELAEEGETTRTVPVEPGEEDGEDEDGDGSASETKEETKEEKINRYEIFWRHFGRVLKEGIHYDFANKDRIARLLRYRSSHSEGLTSLAEYVARMPEDQKSIYYVIADTIDMARKSPHSEGLRAKGFEVLFMSDPVDEWVVEALGRFDDKPLVSAAKGSLDLEDSDE